MENEEIAGNENCAIATDLKASLEAYRCLKFGTKLQALSFKSIVNSFISDYKKLNKLSSSKKF